MISYDITKLGDPSRRGRVIMNPITDRPSTVAAYHAAMRTMLRGLSAEVKRTVVPAYRPMTFDADRNTFDPLRRTAETLSTTASETVERILRLESIRHTETFMDEARKTLGIDLQAVVRQEDLSDYLRTAIERNTSLIKSQSADMVKRIEQAVIQNELNGRSVKTLQKTLTEQFGIGDRKARLLARDQTAKLNSDMNRIRQEQAGIDSYSWATSADERVRPLHQSLQGREYEWGERTGAEEGLPPGQPIQCRCVARAIVEFGEKKKRPRRAEPVPTRLEALDNEARLYVVREGKRTGTEHLFAIDTLLQIALPTITTGSKKHVGFTPAFEAAINTVGARIVAHHNHPSSSSFSPQDILELSRRPGLFGLWAHGHNGSSYYAQWLGRKGVGYAVYETIEKQVRAELQALVYPGLTLDATEAGIIHGHIVMLIAAKRGLIKYDYSLSKDYAAIVEKHRDLIKRLVK